jgi:hypothetical protein
VFGRIDDLKVFRPVVAFVAVDVMNEFKSPQAPSDLLFLDPSMLVHAPNSTGWRFAFAGTLVRIRRHMLPL